MKRLPQVEERKTEEEEEEEEDRSAFLIGPVCFPPEAQVRPGCSVTTRQMLTEFAALLCSQSWEEDVFRRRRRRRSALKREEEERSAECTELPVRSDASPRENVDN